MATAGKATFVTCDLTDYKAVEELFRSSPKFDGVIHFGAIPHPLEHDPRLVHYINNTSSYNVMQTAAAYGIKRMVEASSVNAIGLSYTPEGHKYVHEFPITEDEPMTPVSIPCLVAALWWSALKSGCRRKIPMPYPKRERIQRRTILASEAKLTRDPQRG